MIFRLFVGLLLIGFGSCSGKKPSIKSYFNVDSLINRQVGQLTMKAATATKTIAINDREENLVIKPDSASWVHELGIFRHLDILNKPIYATAYAVTDRVKDIHSNLTLRVYRPTREVPIKEFKMYYQDSFEKLKKIEATIEERNAVYFTARRFVLTFDDLPEGMVLQRYAVHGFQKMILGDTVRFSLSAEIMY